jgi:hypothetical protein
MEREYEWQKLLDQRQRDEIMFARLYTENFHHGTDGHNRLMLIAKMADMLDEAEDKARANDK